MATRDSRLIETVFVLAAGRLLDLASFPKAAEAERYKRGVLRWARDRGITVQIRTQPVEYTRPFGLTG